MLAARLSLKIATNTSLYRNGEKRSKNGGRKSFHAFE